ncbi:MFS transporter [Streptomyces sp. NPDC047017]|uniref:MFS transporter n=1 Tax=Streptomyces sp. NPDC047017 TaxID=3155024 RepID=UPI0033CC1FB2
MIDQKGVPQQAWVTTAYLFTSTIVTPLYGKLSDLFGRKPSYLFAVTVFMVGPTACACATSMSELAAFRAVQGIGAGGLSVLGFTILGEIVTPRERARYQGYFLAVFTGSSVIGPLIGGFLSNTHSIAGVTGWRWAFLINVPLGLLAVLVVYRVLNIHHTRRQGVRVDWTGSAVLTVALAPLLVVAQFGQDRGWGSGRSVVCFTVFGAGTLLFLWAERRAGESALLPLRVFRNTQFTQGTVLAFILGALVLGPFSLVPQYFQVVLGAGPTRARRTAVGLVRAHPPALSHHVDTALNRPASARPSSKRHTPPSAAARTPPRGRARRSVQVTPSPTTPPST